MARTVETAALTMTEMRPREEMITETLVHLADNLVSNYDANEMFYVLVDSCRSVLKVDHAGLMLIDPSGGMRVVAATSEATHLLELLQIQNDEGPCLDAVSSGIPVGTGPLRGPDAAARWPRLAAGAVQAGFTSITALPMRLRHEVLGALNLFFTEDRMPDDRDVSVAQAFADIGTIAILQDRASHDARLVIDQLQRALDSRIVIEQAKGRVAQHAGVDIETAFGFIRRYSRDHNLRLSEVASELIAGTLSSGVVVGDGKISPARSNSTE